jgi:hypothetical protein
MDFGLLEVGEFSRATLVAQIFAFMSMCCTAGPELRSSSTVEIER